MVIDHLQWYSTIMAQLTQEKNSKIAIQSVISTEYYLGLDSWFWGLFFDREFSGLKLTIIFFPRIFDHTRLKNVK